MPALVDLGWQEGFSASLEDVFKCLGGVATKLSGESKLYGRGSHWMSPEVLDLRRQQKLAKAEPETSGWLRDSVQILVELWRALPFIVACCNAGALRTRTSAG